MPRSLHKKNRDRLCERLKKNKDYQNGSIILLEGGEGKTRYSSDAEVLFRQVFGALDSLFVIDKYLHFISPPFEQILAKKWDSKNLHTKFSWMHPEHNI